MRIGKGLAGDWPRWDRSAATEWRSAPSRVGHITWPGKGAEDPVKQGNRVVHNILAVEQDDVYPMPVPGSRGNNRVPGGLGVADLHTVGTGIAPEEAVEIENGETSRAVNRPGARVRELSKHRVVRHGVAGGHGQVVGARIVARRIESVGVDEVGIGEPEGGGLIVHQRDEPLLRAGDAV